MDCRNLADLDIQRGLPKSGMAIAVVCDAACVSQRDVRLHLAFLRQSAVTRLAGDTASCHNAGRQCHALCRRLVDLAIVADQKSSLKRPFFHSV